MREKDTYGKIGGKYIDMDLVENFFPTEYEDYYGEIFPAIDIEYIDGEIETIVFESWEEYEDDLEWLDRYL